MQGPGPSSAYHAQFLPGLNGPIRPPSPPSSPLLEPTRSPSDADSLSADSLYSILNVTRGASTSEIRDRYRSLASTFHPDRQKDEHGKRLAHGRFQEIQRAYEVLTDPSRRMIYDEFGEEGLRTSWDVGPRNMSPEEMKRHFVKQANEHRRLEAEALVMSRGSITTFIDARAVFLPKSAFQQPELLDHDAWSRLKRIRQGRFAMSHSFEVPINDETQFKLSGSAGGPRGKGRGNVEATIKHRFSPRLAGQVGFSLLGTRVLNLKGAYVHSENTDLSFQAVQQTLAAPPRLAVTLNRRLYDFTTGYMSYKTGFYSIGPWGKSLNPELALADLSSFSVGLTTTRGNNSGWTVETSAGLADSHVSADCSTRILGLKIKIGTAAAIANGITGFVDAEAKATEHIRTGMMLQVELNGGLTMALRMTRLGQSVSIPITLTVDLNPYVLLGVTVVPTAGYLAFYRYVILPRKRRQLSSRLRELREENAELITQKRQEAAEAISIMKAPTAKKADQEREKNGLVILDAHYGLAECFTERGLKEVVNSGGDGFETYIDVTIPVQALVNDSTLVIPGGRSKHNLLGFWDPCLGEKKKLRVRYMFRGKIHEVTVDDTMGLKAPMKGHLIEQ